MRGREPAALGETGPLTGLTADADITDDLLGKSASDLQEDVEIEGNAITGTLKAVTGYTGFSGDEAEQSGHYLALHFASDDAETITVELIGGTVGHPVTLGDDGLIVIRITDKSSQTVRVVASAEGYVDNIVTYSLKGLTLAE